MSDSPESGTAPNNRFAELQALPDLAKSQDPVPHNPFPPDDARYEVWNDATLLANQELASFMSAMCRLRPQSIEERFEYNLRFYVGQLDICAKRAINVVWGEPNIAWYIRGLTGDAELILREAQNRVPTRVIWLPDFLAELRARLLERIEHWKSEAYRLVIEQGGFYDEVFAETSMAAQSEPAPASATGAAATNDATPGRTELSSHEQGVQKVKRHFGRDDMPAFVEFYSKIEPNVTNPEFAAWKRGDPQKCGKKKWAALDKAANELA